jgi:hypothetical protein
VFETSVRIIAREASGARVVVVSSPSTYGGACRIVARHWRTTCEDPCMSVSLALDHNLEPSLAPTTRCCVQRNVLAGERT